MTDFRTNRPDHLIPEDAFPATVAIDEATLRAFLPNVGKSAQAQLPTNHPLQQLRLLPETGVNQGLAFYTMGKTSLFNYLGSRYFVIKDTYDLYAGYKEYVANLSGGSVQLAFDTAQTTWLATTFATSASTWKLLGSSVSFSPLLFDLSASRASTGISELEELLDSAVVPDAFKQRFYLEADHWDGFPQVKQRLIENILAG